MGFYYSGVVQQNMNYSRGRYLCLSFLLLVTLSSWITTTAAQALAATTPQPCGGTLTDSGVIQSPNYPLNYPNLARCSWRLLSRSNDTGIRIQFNNFTLENDLDYVIIHNERNNSKRYTGNVKPPTTLAGKEARIEFYSDASYTMMGFTATFSSVNVTSRYQCLSNDALWCYISQMCISRDGLCDGYSDCTYNEDESLCRSKITTSARTTLSPQSECQRLSEFWCSRSAQCVPTSHKCDNYNDCIYGEDEEYCTGTTLAPQSECQRLSKFWCSRSAQCFPTSYKCNKYKDCIYGEDEENCPMSPQVIAGIVAASCGGVAVLLRLFVAFARDMAMRRQRQATPRSNNNIQTIRPSATVWSTPATNASQFGAPNRQAGGP